MGSASAASPGDSLVDAELKKLPAACAAVSQSAKSRAFETVVTAKALATISRALAVPALVGICFVLQAFDWHSTLVAGPSQYESNRILNHFANWLTFAGALALIKLLDLATIWGLFLLWQRSPRLNAVFTLFFTALIAVYGAVVVNNYVAK